MSRQRNSGLGCRSIPCRARHFAMFSMRTRLARPRASLWRWRTRSTGRSTSHTTTSRHARYPSLVRYVLPSSRCSSRCLVLTWLILPRCIRTLSHLRSASAFLPPSYPMRCRMNFSIQRERSPISKQPATRTKPPSLARLLLLSITCPSCAVASRPRTSLRQPRHARHHDQSPAWCTT